MFKKHLFRRSENGFGPLLLLVLGFVAVVNCQAGQREITLAVASNFTAPMKALAEQFEIVSGVQTKVAYGSSGKLFAQIENGAPYDVFLSADQLLPAKLIDRGSGEAGSQMTYAVGTLVLWTANQKALDVKADLIRDDFEKLAIANPKLAPYGQAAQEVISKLRPDDVVHKKIVRGENISQAYQFVTSGNAQLGFIALSQVIDEGDIKRGLGWIVPDDMHSPLNQDLVVLSSAKENPAVADFVDFMKSSLAIDIIHRFGYRVLPTPVADQFKEN